MSVHIDVDRPHQLLHTMIRVSDLDRSVVFYRDTLGLRELRRETYPSGQFTLVFLGVGEETAHAVIELTHNHGVTRYEHGTAFGHIAFAVADIRATCARLAAAGVRIVRPAGPMIHAAPSEPPELMAFIEDPDGVRIELIERPSSQTFHRTSQQG